MNTWQEKYRFQIEELVSVCHRLAKDKYVSSHGGNVSWAVDRVLERVERSNILITPTKKFKGEIKFEDICILDYDGKILYVPEDSRVTGELPFHLLLFHERKDIVSIIHSHPPNITAFAIGNKINYLRWPLLPETIFEVGPVCMVPYAEPLTQKLADNFKNFLGKYNAFLMENHGLTMVSRKSVEGTRQLIDILECTAISIIGAIAFGGIKSIPKEEVIKLDNTRISRGLPLPGKVGAWGGLAECYDESFKEIEII